VERTQKDYSLPFKLEVVQEIEQEAKHTTNMVAKQALQFIQLYRRLMTRYLKAQKK